MGLVRVKALMLIQLLVLFLSCITVFGDEIDLVSWSKPPHHPPIYPPVEAPHYQWWHHHHHKGYPPTHSHPPVHPPAPAPTPVGFPRPRVPIPIIRKFVAVQGVVYCKSCKYNGVDTLWGAAPIFGAVVRLKCRNTKYPIVLETKTDKNGYYFILAPRTITTYGAHTCRVYIVSSPLATCNKPTNLHDGLKGAFLMPTNPPPPPLPFYIFSVGPFAFESWGKCKS